MPTASPNPEICGLTADSRDVRPGFLFAAIPGTRSDGRAFIPEALGNGACAVLAPPGTPVDQDRAVLLETPDPRAALAHLAATFLRPQPETIAAVTGTNGKTSVAYFTRRIWTLLGRKAASIGTLGLCLPDGASLSRLTTPDPVTLHRDLASLAAAGTRHVVIEASSHGLSQRRIDGVRLTAAAFTSFSRDHLDYHASEEAYFAAKMRLFDVLLPSCGYAVVNADDPRCASAAETMRTEVISYGRRGRDLRMLATVARDAGTLLRLEAFGREFELEMPFLNGFQIDNAVCAAGLSIACGEDPDAALACLPQLDDVPGRLQKVGRTPSGATVFVDYAHTPDALAAILQALRPHVTARIFLVFGCGGDRDRGKRPLMGRIAARMADVAILTDDNPRHEDPDAIRRDVLAAAPHIREIPDRAEAIATAVTMLQTGDIAVIAGKGHETGQIIGDRSFPFDDVEVAQNALAAAAGSRP